MGIRSALLAVRRMWVGDPTIPRNATVGRDVYLGPGVTSDWSFGHLITIGDETTIVSGTRILCHDASSNRRLGVTWCAPVSIGRRVYIGADALVLPGVAIGDDVVIAAGAVVTRDIPPGLVVAGVPARRISTTQDLDSRRQQLLASRPVFERDGGGLSLARVSELSAAGSEGGYFIRSKRPSA